jgi:hypothetical protein
MRVVCCKEENFGARMAEFILASGDEINHFEIPLNLFGDGRSLQ